MSTGRSATAPARMLPRAARTGPADQVSGDALPAALPSVKPIDAHSGWVPNGDAGRSGFSQACSGISPTPEAVFAISASSSTAVGALAARYSLLGALAGQRRPQVPGSLVLALRSQTPAQGLPCTVQLVGSPVLQSP